MTSTDTFHSGAGFSGNGVDAFGPVVNTLTAAGRPAALFLEVLRRRTIALARPERRPDPSRGCEPVLARLFGPVLACMALRHGLPGFRIVIVDDGGGHNALGKPCTTPELGAGMGRNADNAARIAATMADARVLVLDGVGHMPHLERPERFDGAVLDFFGQD